MLVKVQKLLSCITQKNVDLHLQIYKVGNFDSKLVVLMHYYDLEVSNLQFLLF